MLIGGGHPKYHGAAAAAAGDGDGDSGGGGGHIWSPHCTRAARGGTVAYIKCIKYETKKDIIT